MEARILVGRFGAPHGVRGEVRLQSFTQDPADIGTYGALVDKAGAQQYEIKTLRPVKDNLFVARIAGIADRTAAETLTNIELFVARAALLPPDEEEFYLIGRMGMAAVDETGAAIGTVIAVPNYGAGDILEVAPAAGGETLLLPFTKAVVPTVDVAARRVTVVFPDETVDPAEQV